MDSLLSTLCFGALLNCLDNCQTFPFLSFQLGNIRHIRKVSFFHHAHGGKGHSGELCNKWCDYYSSSDEICCIHTSRIICPLFKLELTTPMLQNWQSLKLTLKVVLLFFFLSIIIIIICLSLDAMTSTIWLAVQRRFW